MNLGIIAEDDSDVKVVREITLTLLKPKTVGIRRFVSGGCGKLRRKCSAWARILVQQGCRWIVLVHDLDFYDERRLREELTAAIIPAGADATVVLIPKREIEAWLLYDAAAIKTAFHQTQTPRLPGNPEGLPDPKKFLGDLVWKKYRRDYVNTLHNPLIAKHVRTPLLRRSRSFAPHFAFVEEVAGALRRRPARR